MPFSYHIVKQNKFLRLQAATLLSEQILFSVFYINEQIIAMNIRIIDSALFCFDYSGEGLRFVTDKLDSKNYYACNPSFDKTVTADKLYINV